MQEQNFKNHARLVPLYHFVSTILIILIIIGTGLKLYRNYTSKEGGLLIPALFGLIAIALLLALLFARSFALKAQDRAIRAEENLRYFAMTGNLLDSKLTIQQIIALRFAANNEFLDLAHRAVKENMKPVEIKKAIKNWRADYDRV